MVQETHTRDQIQTIGAIIAIVLAPTALFAVSEAVVKQPTLAVFVFLITLVVLSILLVMLFKIDIQKVSIGWVILAFVVVVICVLWSTMTVEGTIRYASGKPVSYEEVVLVDDSGISHKTHTDVEGHYHFKGVPRGEYRVRAGGSEGGGKSGILPGTVTQNLTIHSTTVIASGPTPTSTDIPIPIPSDTPSPNTPTPTPTAMPTPTPTDTPSPTPTPTNTPTTTPSPTSTSTPTSTPILTNTSTPTSTATRTSTDTPTLTATPTPTSIALTIYLRDTLTETGFVALSSDQPNGRLIYEEGKCVYGHAAVQVGEMTYPFDKEAGPGNLEQLPNHWWVEFEFSEKLKTYTGKKMGCAPDGAGYHPKKAQLWVGTLNSDSAVEDNLYSLTMKLYEGNELRESIQVFFTVADAPESPGHGGGTPTWPVP